MNELFVTLGHNSSAIMAVDGEVIAGYEEERIDRVKSSSAYPRNAIELAMKESGVSKADVVHVSHWFDQFELANNKYVDLDHLHSVAVGVHPLGRHFTHHDAHAHSVVGFYRANRSPLMHGAPLTGEALVIDGFGNLQECVSVYDVRGDGVPLLKNRIYGYSHSLGLMYQYTTEYLGMKPHQDEYKLLGYEAHALEYVTREYLESALAIVETDAHAHALRMLGSGRIACENRSSGVIDSLSLRTAKAQWWERARTWRELFPSVTTETGVRSVVAACAQRFLETCVAYIVAMLTTQSNKRLYLAGGVFMNVKLTRVIAGSTGRPVFTHPLAGDQGAALGMSSRVKPRGLLWGRRKIGAFADGHLPAGVSYVDQGEWAGKAARALFEGRSVNVVRGSMEFGPRALCNTSTLAWTLKSDVALINALNDRDEAMPMAPVIGSHDAADLFGAAELDAIRPADRFMITTLRFREPPPETLRGVAHRDPYDPNLWTARPQVVYSDDRDMIALLSELEATCLINTSFNYHGEPIVFSEEQAITTHTKQCHNARRLDLPEPVTILVRSEP